MSGILLPVGCCCGSSFTCSRCSGRTPKRLRVTFSSVVVCPDCYNSPAPADQRSAEFLTPPPAPIGPYVLAQDTVDPCEYNYEADVTGTYRVYNAYNCDDVSGHSDFTLDKLKISAWFGVTPQDLALFAEWTTVEAGGISLHIFDDTKETDICDGPWAMTNELVACMRWPVYFLGGKDGSATVVSLWV